MSELRWVTWLCQQLDAAQLLNQELLPHQPDCPAASYAAARVPNWQGKQARSSPLQRREGGSLGLLESRVDRTNVQRRHLHLDDTLA